MNTAASASKGLVFGLLVGFLLAAAAPPSEANVIYRFEGIPFDTITGTTYTTSDFVIIELEFTDLLLAGSSPGNLTSAVLSWSFMDGQQDFLSSAPDQLNIVFFLNLDSNSLPTEWQVNASAIGGGLNTGPRITTNFLPGSNFNIGFIDVANRAQVVVNPPGQWSIVPEPSTALLLASGLVVLAAKRRHSS